MTSGVNLQAGGGGGSKNKHPQFSRMVEGYGVTGRVEGVEGGEGTYEKFKAKEGVEVPRGLWLVRVGRWWLTRSNVEEQAGE